MCDCGSEVLAVERQLGTLCALVEQNPFFPRMAEALERIADALESINVTTQDTLILMKENSP